MSYYLMAVKFWAEFGLVLGALPVAAVSARGIAGLFAHSLSAIDTEVPLHSRPGPASC